MTKMEELEFAICYAPGLVALFDIGFLPKLTEFHELTDEQYQSFFRQNPNSDPNIELYTLLPDDPKRQFDDDYNELRIVTKIELDFIESALEYIEEECIKSGKEFSCDEDKLRYIVSIIPNPETYTENTKFQPSNLKIVRD
ncbi:MAG: hypothetical protein MJ211_05295 [Bacteroidales bacterium]|nr:hypothetical protein [Bacteroidales bacterium]